jgi:GTP cyclohydrolase I
MDPFNKIVAKQHIQYILKCIGEDPNREGLLDTPDRVVKSWDELFAGYNQNPQDFITTFSEVENYDEMVLLRNIEFYSFCEHHVLPFTGHGHIAYMPDKRVIGISKLARLLDLYARRLQIQERIGQQVVAALDKHLQPRGSACILVAQHGCMSCRGVRKMNSEMVTSSLSGIFLQQTVKSELLSLIGRV